MRGDGRLYRREGSRVWWMAFWVAGREVRASTGEVDERRAKRVLRRRVADVTRGVTVPEESRLTVGELVGLVEADYHRRGLRSAGSLRYHARHVLGWFLAHERARTVTTERVDRYIAERLSEGAAPSSIRSEVHLLNRGFVLAVERGLVPQAARPRIRNIVVGDSNARQGFVSREELEALAAHLDTQGPVYGDFVRFLFYSAWRIGEARTLTWSDYDREAQGFLLSRRRDKAKRGRLLPMAGVLWEITQRRLADRDPGVPWVFHARGRALGDIGKRFSTACGAVGLHGRIPHDLRRSGVRHLRLAGIDQQTIMRFTGHRTEAVFRRYSIASTDDMRAALLRASEPSKSRARGAGG